MEKNVLIAVLAAVIIAAVIFLFALQLSKPATEPHPDTTPKCNTSAGETWCAEKNKCLKLTEEPCSVVGGDRDEHGCIASAGYTWCEYKNKCLRTWEESCEPAHFGRALGEAINAKWGFPGQIYPATSEIADQGWLRGSLNVPTEGATYQSLCAIFMRGNLTRSLDDGTTLYNHNPVSISGRQVCEVAIAGGMVKPCTDLTLHMDLEAMKTGYNRTQDNWEEFFTCTPKTSSAYCRVECSDMMEVLMRDDRSPMVNAT